MKPNTSSYCRDVLDRLRSQIDAHLPPLVDLRNQRVSESIVPLDRLPMIGQLVEQYINAEAPYAAVNQQPCQSANQ